MSVIYKYFEVNEGQIIVNIFILLSSGLSHYVSEQLFALVGIVLIL